MKVKILVEFDVQPCEENERTEFTEAEAKAAASMAAHDWLVFTGNGGDVVQDCAVRVDGWGGCYVSLGEDHE